MPEGHTIHRLARDHRPVLVGEQVSAASPQGRFATGAEMITGRRVERIEAYGKHLFYVFEGDVLLHVHLGLYGKFARGEGPPPEPKGALRLRMVAGDTWLDLRGPTACELMTPADRDAVFDQARIDDVVAKVLVAAETHHLSPDIAEPVWRLLIDRCIAHEFATYDRTRS